MTDDLLSLLLNLRPLLSPENAKPLPTWWGRAAHQLLLSVVNAYDPTLARNLHEEEGLRPYTVSNLSGRFTRGALDPAGIYSLRFTSLTGELTEILRLAVEDGPLAPGSSLELDRLPFQIEEIQPPKSTWVGATGYAELSASLLLTKEPAPRRVSVQLASPTTFKRSGSREENGEERTPGMHVPVPLPELVFGSLLEKWNAFAPIAFPPETKRYAAECLAIRRYKLSTCAIPLKSGGLRVGAVGEIGYTTLNYDRYWMSLIGVLAEFALFAGTGAGTTMGLGQCRSIHNLES